MAETRTEPSKLNRRYPVEEGFVFTVLTKNILEKSIMVVDALISSDGVALIVSEKVAATVAAS